MAPSSKNEPVFTISVESKCCLFFFNPRGKQDPISAMFFQCVPPILFAPRISRTNVDPSSKNKPVFTISVDSKCCFFFLSLEQARSHLCHVGSVCSSHLVCSTHLADKRGSLEQARTSLYHLVCVKVLCETGGVSWQLPRFWKLASDESLGEMLKICSFVVGSRQGSGSWRAKQVPFVNFIISS